MRTIPESNIGSALKTLLAEESPLEEDIGILDAEGGVMAVVITPQVYAFLLDKIEEEDDRIALEAAKRFHESGEAKQ